MKNKSFRVIALVVGAIGSILLLFMSAPEETQYTDKTTVDSLKQELRSMQEAYDLEVESLRDSIVMLKASKSKHLTKIIKLKESTNERITATNNANDTELIELLSDRYKDSLDVK